MYIVDTSVVCFFVRGNPLKDLYRSEIESTLPLNISVQTMAEIIAGADNDKWGPRRRAALQNFWKRNL